MDILEKLREIADAPASQISSSPSWADRIQTTARAAVEEITGLRAIAGNARPSSFGDVKAGLKPNPHLTDTKANEERN